ncbi:hypothetical protein Tco_1204606 [Tanacetum coccineum]
MDRMWVPLVGGVRTVIMDEAHKSRYSVHPEADKMYYDLRDNVLVGRMDEDGYCLTYANIWKAIRNSDWIRSHGLNHLRQWQSDGEHSDDEGYVSGVCIRHSWRVGMSTYCIAEFSYNQHINTLALGVLRSKQYMEGNVGHPCYGLKLGKVGENVLLKVSPRPWKGVMRFRKKGKLAPRYVRPFEILERIGHVAYRLRLPEELIGVHDTFHVLNLKKCLGNANLHVPLNEIKIDKTLRFVEEPVEIIDREVKRLKHSRIPLVKVCWNSKRGPEFTWEPEDYMKSKYPQLFVDRAIEASS